MTELLRRAATLTQVIEIAGHPTVTKSLSTAPTLIREQINDMLRDAHERLRPAADEAPQAPAADAKPQDAPDTVADLLAEIEMMDQVTLDGLSTNGAWRARVRDATAEFPPDRGQIDDAIKARIYALRGGSK